MFLIPLSLSSLDYKEKKCMTEDDMRYISKLPMYIIAYHNIDT